MAWDTTNLILENMNFNSIKETNDCGFSGFKKMSELFKNSDTIPDRQGVYLVLNPDFEKNPEFLQTGTGGHFKGKNPNVTIDELKRNWVEKTPIVYIGKATSLKSRLRQYFRFGQGQAVGHWGGRFIWQLKNSNDLIVCWKELPDARVQESSMIQKFKNKFGKRPFANLSD
jgi:excinuclease UvrABC nuclease subunit